MMSLQEEIREWHQKTFGDCNEVKTYKKLFEEIEEFKQAESGTQEEHKEMADIIICLMVLANKRGFDLMALTRGKFEIVKSRTDQVERDRQRGIE